MVTFYPTQPEARADAAARGLREKVVCFVMRGAAHPELLVFDHVPDDSGVQLPAGGVEPGETPEQAALRELREESGLNLTGPEFLTSYLWEARLPQRFTRQVCHAYALTAPTGTPDTWDHLAEGRSPSGSAGPPCTRPRWTGRWTPPCRGRTRPCAPPHRLPPRMARNLSSYRIDCRLAPDLPPLTAPRFKEIRA
ncbi:NUDIX domain-containing protein [Deinococcus sp. LM3]|uniref:NUDIX domain-containing protein n=1 Tax=Deinococcus sp. LM3 TaxID=1938608 RepID=UPI001F0B6762|nr:NUDIX domain-containing protein [Deinococcus sp. LM3]